MNSAAQTFGQLAAQTSSPSEFIALEESMSRGGRFSSIDAIVQSLLERSLSGEAVVALEHGRERDSVTIVGLTGEHRAILDDIFTLVHQQARGAWILPEQATLGLGWMNWPATFESYPRFAAGIVTEQRGRIDLHASADALFAWAIMEPLFADLFLPFALRGPLGGKKDREWQRQRWEESKTFFRAIGFDVGDALSSISYGSGWSKLRAPEQLALKQALMQRLTDEASHPHAALYRAMQIQRLISRYYQRAAKGAPKLRSVLTKDLQRVLSGYFAGDWLAFLQYIDEAPHPDERIASALPTTNLVIPDHQRVAAVSSAQGVPVSEIERAIAAFWGTGTSSSPIELRLSALRKYWREFDAIHSRQKPGMPPLWGLVDDGWGSLAAQAPYQPGLYRDLLSTELLAEIEALWGTFMLPRWPEKIVSSISPHALLADTLGPALRFWHGCALTAWFICEGPSSRTDLPGLAAYHEKELLSLTKLGCPIDPSIFAELIQSEAQLGSSEPIRSEKATRVEEDGLFRMELFVGTRRQGFSLLRDIISSHRRRWDERYLDAYLRSRWEPEIRDAAREYNLQLERKGSPPTAKQFAARAAEATNHWFGGDISGLYRVIGEKAPVTPARHTILPADRHQFVQSVLSDLEGTVGTTVRTSVSSDPSARYEAEQGRWQLQWLAEESLTVVQREEALGRIPTLDEFGRDRFAYRAAVITPDVDAAWRIYHRAISKAKHISADPAEPSSLVRSGQSVLDVAPPEIGGHNLSETPSAPSPDAQVKRKSLWRRIVGR